MLANDDERITEVVRSQVCALEEGLKHWNQHAASRLTSAKHHNLHSWLALYENPAKVQILGENGELTVACLPEDHLVSRPLKPDLGHGHDSQALPPQMLDNRERDVLVGEKPGDQTTPNPTQSREATTREA